MDCHKLEYINIFNISGKDIIFTTIPNKDKISFCMRDDSNSIYSSFTSETKKSCRLKINIKLCLLFVKNIRFGLYINNSLIKLNKTDNCTFTYNFEDSLSFKNMIYKRNKTLRESQEITIDAKNVFSTGNWESDVCSYKKQKNAIECNFK